MMLLFTGPNQASRPLEYEVLCGTCHVFGTAGFSKYEYKNIKYENSLQ